MATRWWHHDDRLETIPSRVAKDISSTNRQVPSQYQSATAEVHTGAGHKSQGPAPGFNRTGTTALAKAPLPKVWEYEDPLKDVHGPFDAAQIINWFAQDWFGTDLKIRRIGQYWTQLEYVLEELKAEARGCAILPSGGYTTAPQQLPQAATTPAASFSPHRSVAAPTESVSDGWEAAAGIVSSKVRGRGTAMAPAATHAPSNASMGEDAEDHMIRSSGASYRATERGGSARGGGSGWDGNAAGAASREASGGREWEQDEARNRGSAAAGVQLGSDGRWERGHIIGGDSRRGQRGGRGSSMGHQAHNIYGDHSGNRERGDDDYGSTRDRRGRGGSRGGSRGYGGAAAVEGYERATKILEGDEDDEYGAAARPVRGRGAHDARARDDSSARGASGVVIADCGIRKEKHASSNCRPANCHRAMQSGDATLAPDAFAAAAKCVSEVTAAAADDGWGSSTVSAQDGWGPSTGTLPEGHASDNGWGSSSAPAEERSDQGGAQPIKAGREAEVGEAHLTAEVGGAHMAAEEASSPAAAMEGSEGSSCKPLSLLSPGADTADGATAKAEKAQAQQDSPLALKEESEPGSVPVADSAGSTGVTEFMAVPAVESIEPAVDNRYATEPNAHSSPNTGNSAQCAAHMCTDTQGERPNSTEQASPPVILSGVKALIAQQEEQLRQAAAASATPPLSPMRKVSSIDGLSSRFSAAKGDCTPADAARLAESSPTTLAEQHKAAAVATASKPTPDSKEVARITAGMFSRVVGALTRDDSSSQLENSSTCGDTETQAGCGTTDADGM